MPAMATSCGSMQVREDARLGVAARAGDRLAAQRRVDVDVAVGDHLGAEADHGRARPGRRRARRPAGPSAAACRSPACRWRAPAPRARSAAPRWVLRPAARAGAGLGVTGIAASDRPAARAAAFWASLPPRTAIGWVWWRASKRAQRCKVDGAAASSSCSCERSMTTGSWSKKSGESASWTSSAAARTSSSAVLRITAISGSVALLNSNTALVRAAEASAM